MSNFSEWSRIEQVAWAAGFIDGEGCFSITRSRRTKRPQNICLAVSQTEKSVLERVQVVMGGKIYGPRVRPEVKMQPQWRIMIYAPKVNQLWKYLGPKKREQYTRCTQAILDARRLGKLLPGDGI